MSERRHGWSADAADALSYSRAAAWPAERRAPRTYFARAFHLRPDYETVASDIVIAWDMSAIALTAFASAYVWAALTYGVDAATHSVVAGSPLPLIGALLAPFVLYQGRPDPSAWGTRAWNTTLRVTALFGLLVAIGALTHALDGLSPKWALLWFGFAAVAALAGRALLAQHLRILKRRNVLGERVAIVGEGPFVNRVIADLKGNDQRSVAIIGVFDDNPAAPRGGAGSRSGSVADLIELGKRWPLDRIIVAMSPTIEAELAGLVSRLMALDVQIDACSEPAEFAIPGQGADGSANIISVCLARRPLRGWGLVLKFLEDKVLGVLLVILALPVMVPTALAVWLDSPGPVIFRQRRHGLNNAEFEIFKFRTMTWQGQDLAGGERQTRRDDPRVTRIGHFLRKSSIDELPQLLNVLRGEMSLVGPRPHPVSMRTQGQLCSEILGEYAQRHRVRPGLAGLAQINGCRGATERAEQVRTRVAYDIAYAENWSLFLDLKILALTPFRLVFHRGNAF